MAEKIYTVDTLLEAWIERSRYLKTEEPISSWGSYYDHQVQTLESLLGITLSKEGFAAQGASRWWWLFQKTVTSYLNVSTPLDGMLEASV